MSRVLIIQDDNATTDLLKLMLEKERFEVITAHSGQEGIAAASREDLSVVILDMLVPDGEGWEICRAIRKSNPAPIILLSALNRPSLVAKALDSGADEFLVKPVAASMLLAHMKRLARRAQAEKDAGAKLFQRCRAEGRRKVL